MISYNNLEFIDNKLYHGKKATGIKIVPVMYKIKYPDGTESDIFNLSRAKDNAKKWYMSTKNSTEGDL